MNAIDSENRVVPAVLDPDALRRLAAPGPGPRVTLYLPIEREFPQVKQNPVRLEQAAETARGLLEKSGLSSAEAAAWFSRLLAVEIDVRVLKGPVSGIAIFLDRDSLYAFRTPFTLDERVAVGERFLLRPLVYALGRSHRYRLLAVSTKRVALFEGDAGGLRPERGREIPSSLAEAIPIAPTPEEQRSRGETVSHDFAARTARHSDTTRFHRSIADALHGLPDPETPLVLAADAADQGDLRALLRLPGLLPEPLTGSPDHLSEEDLHARAWPLVEAAADRELGRTAALFERARNHGKGLDLVDDIAQAALAGRVRRLWVEVDRRMPGRIDPETGAIQPSDDRPEVSRAVGGFSASSGTKRAEEDVLDALIAIVLERGGSALVVAGSRMPVRSGLAAELR
jgi:hypothetical protein